MAQLGKLIERLPLPLVPPNLKIGREIDRGAWGAVHQGQFEGTSVAVKKIHDALKDADNGDNAVRSFFEECERLKTVDHPHVIKFLGAFKEAKLGPILVMERMNENLRRFLERHRGRLAIKEQIRISYEITQGIAFLHQLTPPMVHRDLNDKNVMFTFDGVTKIGDFGQSRLKQDLYLTSDQPGMVIFMPPEALGVGNSKYDESLDIFSLGVLMLEIATQQQPVPSITGIGTIPEIIRREKHIQKLGDLHPLKPFIVLCLSDDRKKRPKATEMQTVLGRLEENILQTMLVTERTLRKIESDLQVTQEQLTATDAEKNIIQTELDRVKQNENRARLAVVETQRREVAARQQLETELRMARDHLRMVNGEKQSVQMELDRVKEALQEAQDHLSARAVREERIQREHANNSKRIEECARIAEANNQRLQRELAEKQEHELKIMNDLQVTREQLTVTEAEKHIIQTELDRVKQNEDQAIKAVAETQRRDVLARQQLETEFQMARDHLRIVNGEKKSIQMELDRVKDALQEAQDHLSARAVREESIEREHANSLEEALATEKRAKNEFIAQLRYQLEIFGSSNGVQHLGQSKAPADAQRRNIRQKAGGVPLTQPIMWHNEETVGRRDAPSSSSPRQDVPQTLAAKDGSKLRDQQGIDKQLPKAAADATPKEPIVVTPKRVAPPVVIPEAPLIDVNTRKPPAVMPEEPVVATPMATSAAPPKTAPSATPKETPNATPNKPPVAAATSIIATPRVPVATPRVPVATSVAPVNTPRVPAVTSVAPVDTPRVPAVTSVAPVDTPRVPAVTSVAPVDTPRVPVVTSVAPVNTPRVPVVTSLAPVDTPSVPAVTSVAPVNTPRVPVVTSVAPVDAPRAHVATSMAPEGIPSAPVAYNPTTAVASPRAPVAAPRATVAPPRATVAPPRATVAPPRAAVAPPRATVAASRATADVPKAHVATSVAHVDTPSAPHATPKSPTTNPSANQQQLDNKAFPSRGNIDQSQVGGQGPGEMNTHSTEQDSDTQDANMKDAPSCEKCGKIFPWNQRHLLWKHMQECTGSAESGESVSTPTPSVARSQTLPRSTQMRYTGPSTTSGSGESDTQAAATDEDAPKCEKCGRIFPWNQLQLRWKHKCEPTEVARAPDPPRRRVQSSAFNLKRPVSVANIEELFTSSTVEVGVRSASDDATLTCRCGKIFTENQRRDFVIHKLQCREGTPPAPPSAGRHYRGATLPRQ